MADLIPALDYIDFSSNIRHRVIWDCEEHLQDDTIFLSKASALRPARETTQGGCLGHTLPPVQPNTDTTHCHQLNLSCLCCHHPVPPPKSVMILIFPEPSEFVWHEGQYCLLACRYNLNHHRCSVYHPNQLL